MFSPCAYQKVLSKIERKLNGKIRHYFWIKMPICICTWACPRCSFLFFFSFFFFFPPGRCLFLKFYLFIYFFKFTGQASHTSIFFPYFIIFLFFLFTGQASYTSGSHILLLLYLFIVIVIYLFF